MWGTLWTIIYLHTCVRRCHNAAPSFSGKLFIEYVLRFAIIFLGVLLEVDGYAWVSKV